MGKRGPAPLPSNVIRLRGNPGHRPMARLIDQVTPVVEIPSCPRHLMPAARAEWKRISVVLRDLGLISKLDRAALAVYCQAYAKWKWAEDKIAAVNAADPAGEAGLIGRTPSGYQQISAYQVISRQAVEQMHKFLGEFGMSPSSRSRVTPSDLQPWLPGMGPAPDGGSKPEGWESL